MIAHTVKGRGVEMAEFNYKWHTHAPDPETADAMLRELSRRYGKPEQGYSKLWMMSARRRASMAENNPAGAPLEMRDAFGQALVELGREYPPA